MRLTREMMDELLANVIASEASVMLSSHVARGGGLHTKEACRATRKAGGPKNCVIHRPSLHKLTGSPQILRATTLIEDQCKHGIGHANPDSAAFLNWSTGQKSWGVHGCDGCCGPVPVRAKRLTDEADPGWPPQ